MDAYWTVQSGRMLRSLIGASDTMLGRVPKPPGNLRRMLYLADVDDAAGPLQLINERNEVSMVT
jgi:hypothetical protein